MERPHSLHLYFRLLPAGTTASRPHPGQTHFSPACSFTTATGAGDAAPTLAPQAAQVSACRFVTAPQLGQYISSWPGLIASLTCVSYPNILNVERPQCRGQLWRNPLLTSKRRE